LGHNNKKVLIIDDEALIRRMIVLKLKTNGYQVITAKNGEEGLDMIKTQQPDAVITDIMMPKLDGKSVCEQTNHLKKDRPFLTIVITARISLDDEKWINDMHDTLYMEKPFSPAKLLASIDRYFGVKDDEGHQPI
jgi:DNA-binding response OmpR family regulator